MTGFGKGAGFHLFVSIDKGAYFKDERSGEGGGAKQGPKSAVIMYCLNTVGGEEVKKGPKSAVILKVWLCGQGTKDNQYCGSTFTASYF